MSVPFGARLAALMTGYAQGQQQLQQQQQQLKALQLREKMMKADLELKQMSAQNAQQKFALDLEKEARAKQEFEQQQKYTQLINRFIEQKMGQSGGQQQQAQGGGGMGGLELSSMNLGPKGPTIGFDTARSVDQLTAQAIKALANPQALPGDKEAASRTMAAIMELRKASAQRTNVNVNNFPKPTAQQLVEGRGLLRRLRTIKGQYLNLKQKLGDTILGGPTGPIVGRIPNNLMEWVVGPALDRPKEEIDFRKNVASTLLELRRVALGTAQSQQELKFASESLFDLTNLSGGFEAGLQAQLDLIEGQVADFEQLAISRGLDPSTAFKENLKRNIDSLKAQGMNTDPRFEGLPIGAKIVNYTKDGNPVAELPNGDRIEYKE